MRPFLHEQTGGIPPYFAKYGTVKYDTRGRIAREPKFG